VEWFAGRESRQAILARQLTGLHRAEDHAAAGFAIRETRRQTRMDGSVEGSLVRTAWATGELLDLGCRPDDAPVVRTLGFVLSRQNGPGHFGEGCDPERHVARLCTHYLSGFFSAGLRDEAVAPLQFPCGLTIHDEEQARFAASCFALRVVLRAGEDRRDAVRQHVRCLIDLSVLWQDDDPRWPLDLACLALGAITLGPYDLREQVEACIGDVVARQAPDGSWPGAELFNVLDVLAATPSLRARAAVDRTVPHLLRGQLSDGSWEGGVKEERTLIGLRALRVALRAA
jgi:hypothetical protein